MSHHPIDSITFENGQPVFDDPSDTPTENTRAALDNLFDCLTFDHPEDEREALSYHLRCEILTAAYSAMHPDDRATDYRDDCGVWVAWLLKDADYLIELHRQRTS